MKRLVLALLLLLAGSAHAQYGSLSAPTQANQLTITDNVVIQIGITVIGGATPNTTTAGKTTASPNTGVKTLVLFVVGDSIEGNSLPTQHAPTNTTKVLQLYIYNNTVYQAANSLLGTTSNSGGNYTVYIADQLVTDAKFAQVILIPIAIGGATSLDWSTSGLINQRIARACWGARSQGWFTNSNFSFGVIYNTGINDQTVSTTSPQWQARYASWRSSMVGYGCDFDTFVSVQTRLTNVVSATLQAAQAAVVDNVKTFAGPNIDTLTATGSNLQGDNTHLSDAGGVNAAALWTTILEAHYP